MATIQTVNNGDSGFAARTKINNNDANINTALLSAETKLNGIEDNATANSTDADLLNRANHTGSQAISTVTGLQTSLDDKEDAANKGVANGYASLNASGQVPASQLPLSDYFNKTTDTTDDITAGTAKFTTQADIDKLAGIEANATADQTDSEIKTAYENNADTNAFTDAEKTKLAGVDSGATANSTDATLLNRTNHTGQQALSTISDAGLLAGKNTIATSDVDNNAITTAKIQQFASKSVVGRTSAGTGNAEEIDIATTLKTDLNLSKSDVGLANVDNTSDADKPVSTAQQTALDAKLAKASNLSDVTNRQTAINNLTDVASANNEYVLTKDTATGNAVYKPAAGGGSGTNLSIGTTTSTTVDINSDTGNNATIPAATTTVAGLLIASDKTKLDNTSGTNTGDEVAATETVAGIGEIATQAEAEAGADNTNKFLNALKTKQAFDAFLPQKFDTLFNSSVSGGSFTLSKTLSQIISDYKIIIISFTTSIHRSTIAIPTQDLATSITYEIGKFDTRFVNVDTPTSVSSAIFTYSTGVVTVSNAVVIAF
jgi:hypothetical protein